jgi:hypothetical protein
MKKKCFTRLSFLGETTSHSTWLQTTAAKSPVIPLAQGESVARGIWIGGRSDEK